MALRKVEVVLSLRMEKVSRLRGSKKEGIENMVWFRGLGSLPITGKRNKVRSAMASARSEKIILACDRYQPNIKPKASTT